MHRGGNALFHEVGAVGFQWGQAKWHKRTGNAYARNLTFPFWFVISFLAVFFFALSRAKRGGPSGAGFNVIGASDQEP
jgi:hypothetical protein